MEDKKHIKSFNEHQENLNISDVSRSLPRFLTEEDYINVNNLDSHLKGEWAIFRVSGGKKIYISSLYKENLNWNETKLTYSDKNTLKLTKEFATKVGLINKERYVKYIGIVNDKGLQEIL